jgi:hypothetical protein
MAVYRDPADREEDARAGRQALMMIGGIALLLVIAIGIVAFYAMSLHNAV